MSSYIYIYIFIFICVGVSKEVDLKFLRSLMRYNLDTYLYI